LMTLLKLRVISGNEEIADGKIEPVIVFARLQRFKFGNSPGFVGGCGGVGIGLGAGEECSPKPGDCQRERRPVRLSSDLVAGFHDCGLKPQ
jgi:hypothetical protein